MSSLPVPWDELCANPVDYERLVKLLLQRLYGDGQAIDGTGGDGGREFQVRTPTLLALYEAKSFRGRVVDSRRTQITRSLISAARHQPDKWHLVVPIDPNPTEERWFDGLRAGDFPFIDQWHGLTWLEGQLAQHEDLIRFATEDRLLEYVRQYKIETEALARGVPDLLERHNGLDRLADTINPHWLPVVSRLADGTQIVELQPKHPDAGEDAPVTFRFATAIPDDPSTTDLRAGLTLSHELGAGTVDIPGQYLSDFAVDGPAGLGLPGPDAVLDRVTIFEDPETEGLPRQHVALYEPGAAFPLASLEFQVATQTHGALGVRLTAHDLASTVRLTTDVRGHQVTFNFAATLGRPVLPATALPGMRILHALRPPNTLSVTVYDDEHRGEPANTLINKAAGHTVPDEFLAFVEDLAVIQDRLRHPFPLPDTIRGSDLRWANQLRRLLEGETVPWIHGTLTATLDPDKIAGFKAQFPAGGGGLRVGWDDQIVSIGGVDVHTGPMYMTGIVTIDLDAIPDQPTPGQDVTTTFHLVDEQRFQARLGMPPDGQPQTDPTTPPRGRVSYNPTLLADAEPTRPAGPETQT